MLQDIFATIGFFWTIWFVTQVIVAKVTLWESEDYDCPGCPECEW